MLNRKSNYIHIHVTSSYTLTACYTSAYMKYAYAAMRECIYIPSYFHGYCRATKISIFEARATAYCEQFYIETIEHVGIRLYGKSHGTIFILTIESNISDPEISHRTISWINF